MDQEDERVLYNIQNGTRMVSMLLFADARMNLSACNHKSMECYGEGCSSPEWFSWLSKNIQIR